MGLFWPKTLNPGDEPRIRLGRRLHWAGLIAAGAVVGAFPLIAPSDLSGPPDYAAGLAISLGLGLPLALAGRGLRLLLAKE